MSNFNIKIIGSANLSQVTAEFARLEAQVNRLNAEMKALVQTPMNLGQKQKGVVNPEGYSKMMLQMKRNSQVFRDAAASTGMFEAQQLRVNSATDEYTRALEKQKVSFRGWIKQQEVANAAYREQLALRSMVVRKMPGTIGGKQMLDVIVPNEALSSLNTLGNRIGWVREQVRSASTQMINWGKNTQWAGRQLMVGFTMPVAAFGVATGILAYKTEADFNKIAKVYDYTSAAIGDATQHAVEKNQLLNQSMELATQTAVKYGATMKSTLDVEQQLAATGLKGQNLSDATNEVLRVSTLGDIDPTQTTNMVVSLQTAFRKTINTSGELTNALNFMNAASNASSLSLQDIAEATPRAATSIANLGGTVQDMTALLVSMREAGVEAAQGANALKSASTRIIKPSADAIEFYGNHMIDIMAIAKKSGGNLFDYLKMLGEEQQKIVVRNKETGKINEKQTALTRAQGVAALFGTYQNNRLTASLVNLADAYGGVQNQTAKVLDLSKKSNAELQTMADQSMSDVMDNAAGRMKRAWAELTNELSQMGKPFLAIGSSIVSVIQKIVAGFNNLPDGLKKILAGGAIFMALVGPLVMLTGLFANFFGNMLKGGVFMTGILTKFELLNKESRASQLASKLASDGFTTQAGAVANLTEMIEKLTLAQLAAMRLSGQLPASFTGPGYANGMWNPRGLTQMQNGQWRAPNGQFSKPPIQVPSTLPIGQVGNPILLPQSALPPAKAVQEDTKAISKNMNGAALAGGLFAASMVTSMVSSNKTVDSIAQITMMSAMLGPSLVMGFGAIKGIEWASIATTLKTGIATGMARASAGAWTFAAAFAKAPITATLNGILGLVGPVGLITASLVAAGAALVILDKRTESARDNVKQMYEDTDALAKILDFTPTNDGMVHYIDEAGNSVVSMAAKVQKFREEYGYVVDKIRGAEGNDAKQFTYANSQGLKVIDAGGTAEQAKTAVQIALEAAGKSAEEAKAIMIKFAPQLDYSKTENLVKDQLAQVANHLDDAKFVQPSTFGFGNTLHTAAFGDWLDEKLPDKLSNSAQEKEIDRVKQEMADAGSAAAKAYTTALGVGLSTASVEDSAQKTLDALNAEIASTESGTDARFAAEAKRKAFLEYFIKGYVKDTGSVVDNLSSGSTILDLMKIAHMSISSETATTADNVNLSADAAERQLGAVEETTAAQKALNREIEAKKNVQWVDEYKSAMQATQTAISDIATNNFTNKMNDAMDAYSKQQNARLDRMDNRQQNAQDRFNKRWDRRKQAVSDAYDARMKNIDDEIKAEQKADEIRQRIFEAEITRMQRLAEMANTNIDFNVAINTGNLDEAAKIRNDMAAKETEWALGDSGDKSSRASQRRQDELNRQKDHLDKMKEQRLKHLDEIEQAEQKALQRRQERNKAALQEEVDNNIAAQQEIWDNRKEKLDRAIELFQNYVPKNEQDLKNHIARISEQYSQFNVDTEGKFKVTSVDIGNMLQQNVQDAARGIKDDIRWAGVGDHIAREMIRGAFGMSPKQFQNWLITGSWPEGADITAPDYPKDSPSSGMKHKMNNGDYHFHTGGIVGKDKGGHAGIRRGHPDEVKATLLKGEGVLNRDAMSKIGPTGFRALNNGESPYGTGGASGLMGLGIAGIMGAMMYRAVARTLQQGIINGGQAREAQNAAAMGPFSTSFMPGQAGMYSDRFFGAEQLKNAATIASVGKSMGMSARDIEIGIMTAITESGLVNVKYGDRDSLGLFQQRPSMGWGTPEQVTNPEYAARKFFSTLQGVSNRSDMAPWLAAQSVQRSAYADGSNYRQYWDNALAIFKGLNANGGVGAGAGGFIPGPGGRHRPVPKGYGLTQGIHDSYTGFPAVDFGVPVGTTIYAAADGKVANSYDLKGYEPRNAVQNGYRSYGRVIQIDHGPFSTLYAHLSSRYAQTGQNVKGGSVIGKSGNTGHSTGPHLHFGAQGISPMSFVSLQKGAQNIKWDNTIANLHKGEAVLTEDINRKFREGVDRFAEGPNAQYNLNMTVTGSNINADELVQKAMTAFRRMEMRKPQSRSGN